MSAITTANEKVTINQACNIIGMDIPDFEFGNMKLWCPFGDLYHADGGQTRAFRVYPQTNSAYCFACGEYYSPVKLLAKANGVADEEAAEALLTHIGYVEPTVDARWEALMSTPVVVDHDALSEALKVACARMDPTWEDRQFEELVSTRFRKCLSLLAKVTTEEEATTWLSTTKTVMQRTLGEAPS